MDKELVIDSHCGKLLKRSSNKTHQDTRAYKDVTSLCGGCNDLSDACQETR